MKLPFSLLFLFALLPEGRAQQAKIDSLDRLIRQAATDTARINLTVEKINRFFAINLDSAVSLAEKTIAQAQRIHYRKGEAYTRSLLASGYAYKGEYAAAEQNLHRAETMLLLLKDATGLCRVYGGYGMMYGMQSQYDSAIVYYEKAITIAQQINNQALLNSVYQNIAISYQMQSRHAQALSYFQRALQFYEKQNNETSQANINLNMGLTYIGMGDTSRAERSLLKAVTLAKKAGAKNVELYTYSNLASLYEGEKKYPQSYQNALKAAALGAEMGDIGIRAASLSKAASALAFQQQYGQAEQLDRQAIAIADSSRQPFNIYQAYSTMGLILKLQQKYAAAIPYLEKAFHTLKQTDRYDEYTSEFYLTLSECYEKTGDPSKALMVYKMSAAVADSIRNKENIRKATELTMNYEFEKKQQAVRAEQQRQNAITQARQLALLVGLGLTVLLAAVASYAYVNKQKANALLQQQKRAIGQALSALQSAQGQLIQQEKMASLGQLTAGVAHEINNPINFISSNISPLKRDIESLKEVIHAYEETNGEGNGQEKVRKIRQLKQEMEYDYVLDEINLLLVGMKEGADRIAEIVKILRNFTRLDEDHLEKADVHEGLDSTLVMLQSQLKNRIEIRKEYGKLSRLTCYPGRLNQVFLNILTNAIQAIEGQGQIEIRTSQQGEEAVISIRDTGMGIPAELQQHIFEPFFTTKDVGKGAGLGLSVSYGIVEQHQGRLAVESEPGKGARFIITLPVDGRFASRTIIQA